MHPASRPCHTEAATGKGPGERINKLAHKAIYDLPARAANDIRNEVVEAGRGRGRERGGAGKP